MNSCNLNDLTTQCLCYGINMLCQMQLILSNVDIFICRRTHCVNLLQSRQTFTSKLPVSLPDRQVEIMADARRIKDV